VAEPLHLTDSQIRVGAWLGLAHVVPALIAHWAVPSALEERLGLVADPWFRRETGTVNAGFAYGLVRILYGHRDATFLKTTALSGSLMAATRTIATLRGRRRGPLSLVVILSDLILSIGGFVLARQFEHDRSPASAMPRQPETPALSPTTGQYPRTARSTKEDSAR